MASVIYRNGKAVKLLYPVIMQVFHVINSLGGGHTHTYQRVNNNDFKKLDERGQRPCTPGLIIECRCFAKHFLVMSPCSCEFLVKVTVYYLMVQ